MQGAWPTTGELLACSDAPDVEWVCRRMDLSDRIHTQNHKEQDLSTSETTREVMHTMPACSAKL